MRGRHSKIDVMANTVKTALLLGALSALLPVSRRSAGRRAGAGDRLRLRRRDELRVLLVLRQDRPEHVSARQEVGPGPPPVSHRRPAGRARRAAAAALLRHSGPVAQRVRHRPQSAACRGRRHRRHSADPERRGARGRPGARARAREAPRHPHQLGGGHAGRGHHDDVAVRDVLRRAAGATTARARIRSRCSRRSSWRRSRPC